MQIAWVEAALLDIAVIKARIAADDPRAADQQVQRVLRAIARLVEFPRLGREGRISGTRELIVSRTPYLVAYRIGALRRFPPYPLVPFRQALCGLQWSDNPFTALTYRPVLGRWVPIRVPR